jgi:class 3 adenylate cyclase/predicted ATPase/DNA-binding winged helix-turn-helix (wHTH) protein
MASSQWCFADFRLDPANACLWRGPQPVALTPKAFDVLQYLVTHPDRLVTKDTLLDAVWPETAISDAVVRIAIGELRRALGDTAQAPRFIATVHRRGYRFVAPITEHPEAVPEPARPVLPTLPPLDTPAVPHHGPGAPPPATLLAPEAERRHLTVLFCDLVDSTRLAGHLDPEDLREVVRVYHETCAAVIQQYDGYIAQYLGDGILGYFGYPRAHDDDAQRAVRTGLGILHAMDSLNTRLLLPPGKRLAVRLGIHTGLVVVGEVGAGARQEPLALGETPNLAARLQGLAAPNTVLISATTWHLLEGFFACQALGPMPLQGRAQPLEVYQVLAETTARSRLEAVGSAGLTPLVGREQEVGLLRERWAQVKEGVGQVVLLSGEAGIGKSRLVQVLTEHVAAESQAWLTPCQCSPYYQHTALYPMIDLLERVVLCFDREEFPPQKLRKLKGFVMQYGLPLAEAVPLCAALLSLPLADDYPPLHLSPEQQKQKTLHALLTILLHIAAQQPVLFVMEDLHWVDPSTLELLSLLVDQGPTARILALFTCRPDFIPPWTGRSHLTQVTLSRLPRRQAAELTGRVAHGKALPPQVVEQIVAKTDGVPLFVEELTKMVLESGLLQEREEGYALTEPLPALAIPTTLYDSLMARLDRLEAVKGLAQLAATLGREFAYDLLHAVSPWDEATLRQGLQQLVEAEFLYQRGLPPQATYLFKHALIQDAAYQSLLKRTRQQYHQQIAQVLEALFPETVETQPELLAQHYTEAGLHAQALPFWYRAGQRANERSAHLEAIAHLTKGLDVLTALPDTPERTQHELEVQSALGLAFMATKGYGAPEVGHTYARARELCQQLGHPPLFFQVLWGLQAFHLARGELRMGHELGEQCFALAHRAHDPALLLAAHQTLGVTAYYLGELMSARAHLEQGIALYDPQQHRSLIFHYGGLDFGVQLHSHAALALWLLGYPEQALQRTNGMLHRARELPHPYSLVFALNQATVLSQLRRDGRAVQERAEEVVALCTAQGFPQQCAMATILRGWGLVAQGQAEEGIAQMHQGLAISEAIGTGLGRPPVLAQMADAYGQMGQPEEGLRLLAEALAVMDDTGERWWEAEVHRLQGELLLRHTVPDTTQAEACFRQALEIARRQAAKSLELRAATSLSRLWQQQGKRAEARALLAPIYGWFTEGFDTADLQEAKALLEA